MIKSARLQNYESHEDSLLEFHEGINVIIGDSDKGKSGIFRGIAMVPTNKLAGIEHVSHWCLTKTEEIKAGKEMRVTLDNGEAVVTRVRSAKINGYEISTLEKPLEAIRTEVPAVVSNALNISSLNIQRQSDGPFLIGRPGGEVARYINELVRLDDIDKFIAVAKDKVKKNKEEVEVEQTEIKKLDASIAEYEWIDKIAQYVSEIKTCESKLPLLETELNLLITELSQYSEALALSQEAKVCLRAVPIVAEIKTLDAEMRQKWSELEVLTSEIESYGLNSEVVRKAKKIIAPAVKALESIKKLDSEFSNAFTEESVLSKEIENYKTAVRVFAQKDKIAEAEAMIEEIKKIVLRISSRSEQIQALDAELILYNKSKDQKAKLTEEIKALVASRPKNCPTCGKPLGDCDDK